MNTRTGLAFGHVLNGAVTAQYRTHSGAKAQMIMDAVKLAGYSVLSIPLLHTNEIMLSIVVGKHVKKVDYDKVCVDFKAMWREMRAEQKSAVCGTSALDASFED